MKVFSAVMVVVAVFAATANALEDEPTCPEKDDIFNPVHFPHPTSCEKFYKCFNGEKIEMDCPDGLHWNIEKDYCDHLAEADCVRPLPFHAIN
ncbi:peritrophin-1-like [Anopheles cruzii]|uniref:peritrophin-1-like n=1 Tax=Anopheles cruzii TaxID=68878 RepID=UPI0022EC20E6|nr:peritrophin-1-like [Anopheles cruzii]